MTHNLNLKDVNTTQVVVSRMMIYQMPIINDWFGNAKKQFSNPMEFFIQSENVDGSSC